MIPKSVANRKKRPIQCWDRTLTTSGMVIGKNLRRFIVADPFGAMQDPMAATKRGGNFLWKPWPTTTNKHPMY